MGNAPPNLRRLFRNGDLWLVAGLFGTILLLIIPIPAFLLDLLLVVSMALALLILLVIIYLREPADFTGFPTMLLFVTLFRLSLNVASTRLILLDAMPATSLMRSAILSSAATTWWAWSSSSSWY